MLHDHNHNNAHYAILFRDGNEKGLSFFYHEFYPSLAHYSYQLTQSRPLAEEIASEAFIKTWKMHYKLDSYNGIKAYLYKIVHRDSIKAVTREKRRSINYRHGVPQVDTDSPFDLLVRSEVYRMVHAALKELSAASRRVMIMHYLEGKSTGQISRELNLHASTIKTQKKQGLNALKKVFSRPMLWVFYFSIRFLLLSQ